MAGNEEGVEETMEQHVVALRMVSTVVVEHDDRAPRAAVLDLDFLTDAVEEVAEVVLVGGVSYHEDWLAEARSDSPKDCNKSRLIVDVDVDGIVLEAPGFRLSVFPSTKGSLVTVDDLGPSLIDETGQNQGKLRPLLLLRLHIKQSIAVDNLTRTVANVKVSIEVA